MDHGLHYNVTLEEALRPHLAQLSFLEFRKQCYQGRVTHPQSHRWSGPTMTAWRDPTTRFEINKTLSLLLQRDKKSLPKDAYYKETTVGWLSCGDRFLRLLLAGLEFLSSAI